MKLLKIFLLSILILGLIGVGYYVEYKNKDMITIGNIEISSANLKVLNDPMPEGKFVLCSLKEKDSDAPCIVMFKRNLKYYQGPVPKGYNETHFRLTGETILLKNN